MDLLIAFLVLIAIIVGGSVLLAMIDGRDVLDFDPQKRLERRYAAEAEDMDNLLEQHNARRRANGLPEQDEYEFDMERRKQERKWK